jgi:hypothetical protein
MDCNDDNPCTSSTKCQPNGTCGGGIVNMCDDNPCKTNRTCQTSNGSCTVGDNVGKGTDCGNNKVCNGMGTCACRTKSDWNLLTNPGFDGNANSWILANGAAYKGNVDVNSCSGSGSVALTAVTQTMSQCVQLGSTLTAARTIYFGYRIKGAGACDIEFYDGNGACNGSRLGGSELLLGEGAGDAWDQRAGSALAPANTTHVYLSCSAVTGGGPYDQLFLSTSPQSAGAF